MYRLESTHASYFAMSRPIFCAYSRIFFGVFLASTHSVWFTYSWLNMSQNFPCSPAQAAAWWAGSVLGWPSSGRSLKRQRIFPVWISRSVMSAPIEVDEYADFQCPYCRSCYLVTMPDITERLIQTGKIRWRC